MEYNNAACKADRLLVEFKDRKKMLFCEASPFGVLLFRVYLKTENVTGSEEFLRCARHFFAGILTYFKEK